jgi:hypothetical protein
LARWQRSPEVEVAASGDELLLVHLGTGGTFQLNRTGRAIFELAAGGLSPREIGARLAASLGASAERLERDAVALVRELEAQRLLEPA